MTEETEKGMLIIAERASDSMFVELLGTPGTELTGEGDDQVLMLMIPNSTIKELVMYTLVAMKRRVERGLNPDPAVCLVLESGEVVVDRNLPEAIKDQLLAWAAQTECHMREPGVLTEAERQLLAMREAEEAGALH